MTDNLNETMFLPKEVKCAVSPSGPYSLCSRKCQFTEAKSFELSKLFLVGRDL